MPDQPISPLVADLITASLTQTHQMTNRVIDNLTEERDEARAELEAVRRRIEELMSGRYMPMPHQVIDALYPFPQLIAEVRDAQDS